MSVLSFCITSLSSIWLYGRNSKILQRISNIFSDRYGEIITRKSKKTLRLSPKELKFVLIMIVKS